MGKLGALIKKELRFYLNSAIAYSAAVLFLVFTAIFLFDIADFFTQNAASLRAYFSIIPWAFVVLIPALTMRSWSEEMRMGTYEVLLTMPYPQWKLVMAKFLSPLILVVAMLVLTIPVPVMLSALGDFDLGIIVTQYLGALLLATASIAIGTYISSLTKNQIMAFLGSLVILLVIMLIGVVIQGGNLPDWLIWLLSLVSLNYHFNSFVKGIIDSRDVLFFLVVSALFLFLSERRLLLRKWS